MIDFVLGYIIMMPLLAAIPPMVAKERGVQDRKNIWALSVASILLPILWPFALLWAIIEKPSEPVAE